MVRNQKPPITRTVTDGAVPPPHRKIPSGVRKILQSLQIAVKYSALWSLIFSTTVVAHATPTTTPLVIAHRGGTADYPENTLTAIRAALTAGVDGLWLTVQVSSDGIPVLYRPIELSALTDGNGQVRERTAAELTQLNAGWNFHPSGSPDYPYRDQPTPLPTVTEALQVIPSDVLIFLDIKQELSGQLIEAVARVIRDDSHRHTVVLYSTEGEITEALYAEKDLTVAESRDITRQRLLNMALAHTCAPQPATQGWAVFEMHRTIAVTEEFTLGSATSPVNADLWSPEAVACFTQRGPVHTLGIGATTAADYRTAAKEGLTAVLVDSPQTARLWK